MDICHSLVDKILWYHSLILGGDVNLLDVDVACIILIFKQSTCIFIGHHLATKVFIGKLPATTGVWVIIG